ncbi:hypothetical protein GCM10010171_31630 [Actinokineospora fastidiosa]|uniref:Uncharacterized protein n=2 Tax=Actinokineospora fastidiosa TaxID=1816 RepID=A0A918GGE9_9PSEU|nr:hypothetical protein GCM10010171_31630 [Actinokineospora fastidiosa]
MIPPTAGPRPLGGAGPRVGTIARMVGPNAIPRWLLACALVFAVLSMHHLASTDPAGPAHHGSAASASHDCCPVDSEPAGDHGLLHLCLAILLGMLVLVTALVGWRLRRASRGRAPPRSVAVPVAPPSPVLPGGRATLHSVCVLRL